MNDQTINIGQLEIRYLVDGSARSGLGVFEMSVPFGAHVPPPHSHGDNDECVYVLSGPGEWMSTPRGAVHHFSNPGSQTARVLVIMTPDIGEQYFREIATVVNVSGPPDRASLLEIMTRYGLVLAAQKPLPAPGAADRHPAA
jgi:mannose-6-phosphate isomerase-like protein (cupin superfamily)